MVALFSATRLILLLTVLLILSIFVRADVFADTTEYDYLIYVDYNNRTLTLFSGDGETLAQYPIVIPRVIPPKLPMEADVRSIDKDPVWRPTEKTRLAYAKKNGKPLPETVSSFRVNSLNAMGTRRINLNFTLNQHFAEIKIHGTNAPELVKKQLKVSRGCIRMLNEDIEKMSEIISGHKTKVVFGRGERKLASLFLALYFIL